MSFKQRVAKKGVDDMTKVQNLRLRGKTYSYHRYIPEDVRSLFDGKDQPGPVSRRKTPQKPSGFVCNSP